MISVRDIARDSLESGLAFSVFHSTFRLPRSHCTLTGHHSLAPCALVLCRTRSEAAAAAKQAGSGSLINTPVQRLTSEGSQRLGSAGLAGSRKKNQPQARCPRTSSRQRATPPSRRRTMMKQSMHSRRVLPLTPITTSFSRTGRHAGRASRYSLGFDERRATHSAEVAHSHAAMKLHYAHFTIDVVLLRPAHCGLL
jgi:hypothetical protein